jgi:hypothetical protein
MPINPFLPGLILALAVWILPLSIRLLPARMTTQISERIPQLPGWAPWIRSIALPYLGLLLGWISSRDFGLTGQTAVEWIVGIVAAAGLGILLGWMSMRLSIGLGWGVIGDEARWTLYRAAAWPFLGYLPLAVAAGLIAGAAEFALGRKFAGEGQLDEVGLLFLVHAACSAVLFLLAHNFFLAMLFYLAAALASKPDFRLKFSEVLIQIRRK